MSFVVRVHTAYWNKCTDAQLKEELTKRGLQTPGEKAELIERLTKYEKGMLSHL